MRHIHSIIANMRQMIIGIVCYLIFSSSVYAISLFSDIDSSKFSDDGSYVESNVADSNSMSGSEQVPNSYKQAEPVYRFFSESSTPSINYDECLERYVNVVFRLSQVTPKLFDLSNETKIASDIQRLDAIANKIKGHISDYSNRSIYPPMKQKRTQIHCNNIFDPLFIDLMCLCRICEI